MTASDDEEEVTTTSHKGRPNLWWQQQREEQERDVFKGEYRAVRGTPRGGQATVKPEDTLGSYDLCYCGLSADHDWPGKDRGRRHPKEMTAVSVGVADPGNAPKITNRELAGFDDDVKESVAIAVNVYGCRYRLTKSGLMLFPKDDSDPYTIHKNPTPRTIKALRIWVVKHVVELEKIETSGLVRPEKARNVAADDMVARGARAQKEIDDEMVRRLAEKVNSEEHKVIATKAVAKKAAKKTAVQKSMSKDGGPAPQSTEPTRRPERHETRTYASKPEVQDWRNPVGQWGPHRRKHDGQVIPGFERFGDTAEVRCTRFKDEIIGQPPTTDEPCGWVGLDRAVAGHLLNHDPEKREAIWGKKAQEKKRKTIYTAQMAEQIKGALDILHEAVGYEPEANNAEVQKLEKRIAVLEADLAKAIKERDDVQAKFDLMKEVISA